MIGTVVEIDSAEMNGNEKQPLLPTETISVIRKKIANFAGGTVFANQIVSSALLLYIGYDSSGRLVDKVTWLASAINELGLTPESFQIFMACLSFSGVLIFGGTAGFHNAKNVMLEGLPKKHKKTTYSSYVLTALSGIQNAFFMSEYPGRYQNSSFSPARWFAQNRAGFIPSAYIGPLFSNAHFLEDEWRRLWLSLNYYPVGKWANSAVNFGKIFFGYSIEKPIDVSAGLVNGAKDDPLNKPAARKFAYYAVLSLQSVLKMTKSEELNSKISTILLKDKKDDEIIFDLVELFNDEASKLINTGDFTWAKTLQREFGKFVGYLTTVSSWGPGFAAGGALGRFMGLPHIATLMLLAVPIGLANCYTQGGVAKNTISQMFVSLYNKLFLPKFKAIREDKNSAQSKSCLSSSDLLNMGWSGSKAVFGAFVVTAVGVMNFGIGLAFPTFPDLVWLNDIFAGANALGNSASTFWGLSNSAFANPYKPTIDKLEEWLISIGDLQDDAVLQKVQDLRDSFKVPTNDELGFYDEDGDVSCLSSVRCCR